MGSIVCSVMANALFFSHLTPKSYEKDQVLDVHVGQLISPRTAYPFDFYKLNWCSSVKGRQWDPETVGVSIRDNKFVESPYQVSYKLTHVLPILACFSTSLATMKT